MDARLASITLALALGAACSGNADPRPPRPPPPPSAIDPRLGPPVPALPGDGERAFVADERGLVEVSTAGGSQVVAPVATWCSVDARASVVWFVDGARLRAFDLADRRTRTILEGPLDAVQVIIDWGQQQLGGESSLLFDVGAAIRMTARPTIEVVMGCFGDRMVYCFEEGTETPTAAVAKLQRIAGNLVLADPAYVASLAARGRQASLWSPPPMPPSMPKATPTVDNARCTEDPSRCGSLTAIPGSPLWLVHTSNSRGDYYHETRALWDPATGEYLHRDGARLVRSKTAPPYGTADTDYGGLRVSPRGTFAFDGAVFDGAKVYYAPRDPDAWGARSCGWTGGGWRIPGPTDDHQ